MRLEERMLERLRGYIDRGHICGAYLKVRKNGALIADGGVGTLGETNASPVTETSLFRVMSMTKPVTAAAAMTFVEEGKLSLTDRVGAFLPAYAEKHPDLQVLHLLNHSCGLGMTGMPGMMASIGMCDPGDRLADRVERWAGLEPDFAPGEGTGYSGAVGFDILARIMEVISGKELDEVIRERITVPLRMEDTGFVPGPGQKEREAEVFRDRNIDHTPAFEAMTAALIWSSDAVPCGYFAGCAGLRSTARDYDRFAQMMRNGGILDGVRVLEEETLRQMRTPQTKLEIKPDIRWGLGMQVFGDPEKSGVFVHPGSFGWSGAMGTHFFVDPRADVTFVLMLNADGLNGSESFISRELERILYEDAQ